MKSDIIRDVYFFGFVKSTTNKIPDEGIKSKRACRSIKTRNDAVVKWMIYIWWRVCDRVQNVRMKCLKYINIYLLPLKLLAAPGVEHEFEWILRCWGNDAYHRYNETFVYYMHRKKYTVFAQVCMHPLFKCMLECMLT